jgi:hypothetical protein
MSFQRISCRGPSPHQSVARAGGALPIRTIQSPAVRPTQRAAADIDARRRLRWAGSSVAAIIRPAGRAEIVAAADLKRLRAAFRLAVTRRRSSTHPVLPWRSAGRKTGVVAGKITTASGTDDVHNHIVPIDVNSTVRNTFLSSEA